MRRTCRRMCINLQSRYAPYRNCICNEMESKTNFFGKAQQNYQNPFRSFTKGTNRKIHCARSCKAGTGSQDVVRNETAAG